VLFSLSVPTFIRIAKASNVYQGGKILVDNLNLARQTAAARNQPVEFRLYYTPGPDSNPTTGDPDTYTCFQLFFNDGTPMTKPTFLPNGVIIANDPKVSSLLTRDATGELTNAVLQVPGYRNNTKIKSRSFKFRPTGETEGLNLAPDQGGPECSPFMTIHSLYEKVNDATGVPPNFFTVQINPSTGRVRSYRP
jgi:uncharacterized protein (TIGR02596 family)